MIKKRYNITIEGYNNIVKEITFTGKRDKKNRIVVVFRRSDMKNPIVYHSQDFIDLEFKNNFIRIAKSMVVWYLD
jgi:hypothetical protein